MGGVGRPRGTLAVEGKQSQATPIEPRPSARPIEKLKDRVGPTLTVSRFFKPVNWEHLDLCHRRCSRPSVACSFTALNIALVSLQTPSNGKTVCSSLAWPSRSLAGSKSIQFSNA
jgi:hypothetical protein